METYREKVMKWWNSMTLEQKFYKTIEANSVIAGDRTRHPESLTGSEIERIFEWHLCFKEVESKP